MKSRAASKARTGLPIKPDRHDRHSFLIEKACELSSDHACGGRVAFVVNGERTSATATLDLDAHTFNRDQRASVSVKRARGRSVGDDIVGIACRGSGGRQKQQCQKRFHWLGPQSTPGGFDCNNQITGGKVRAALSGGSRSPLNSGGFLNRRNQPRLISARFALINSAWIAGRSASIRLIMARSQRSHVFYRHIVRIFAATSTRVVPAEGLDPVSAPASGQAVHCGPIKAPTLCIDLHPRASDRSR